MMIDLLKEALQRAAAFCAYQERTQQEVRDRLAEWGVCGGDAEEIIVNLIEQDYLNEQRFARAFAGGKFRVKRWGKHKIQQHLKQRGFMGYSLEQAMAEIEPAEYRRTLIELLERKKRNLSDKNPLVVKQKLARFAIGKGYESELVWAIIGSSEE